MLSNHYRFHGHGSLRYVYRNGQTARNRSLLIKVSSNKRRTDSRVAVIVGKKIYKSAVKRNRIRRRIFEVLRRHWDMITPGNDIALTVFSAELLTMPADELEQTVLHVLRQATILESSDDTVTPVK